MALADRVDTTPPKPIHGKPCSVGELLTNLPESEAAALQHMLSSGWSQQQIYDAVRAEGHDCGKQTINRHRSSGCRCFQ